jgi:hypothetical protein
MDFSPSFSALINKTTEHLILLTMLCSIALLNGVFLIPPAFRLYLLTIPLLYSGRPIQRQTLYCSTADRLFGQFQE